MKKCSTLALLCVLGLAGTAYASDPILPDACGAAKVEFNVVMSKPAVTTAGTADGVAHVVFVQTVTRKGHQMFAIGKNDFTTRFGVDGAWVGAAANDSYFAVDVPPGTHHLCASVQGTSKTAKEMVGAMSFKAEAGTTYYFQFTAERTVDSRGGNYYSHTFETVNEDEGKYRTRALSVSTGTAK